MGEERRGLEASSGPEALGGRARGSDLGAVPLWRRFHVRTALLFGTLGLSLLAGIGALSLEWARGETRSALSGRLEALAVSMAASIEPDELDAARSEGPRGAEERAELFSRFRAIAEAQPDVQSLYVMVPATEQGQLRFVVDWVRRGRPARFRDTYDPRQAPAMIRGFRGPTVEREVYTDAWGTNLSAYAPVRDRSGEAVAIVGVDVAASRIEDLERQVWHRLGWIYGVALAVLVGAGVLLGQSVRRPIARIIEASGAIASGQRGTRVGLARNDELGILAVHFDRMAREFEERERLRALFGRYLSEDIARRILSSPDAAGIGGEEREVTVLFVDLARFSVVIERVEPASTVALLSRYATEVTEVIERHGGCVVEMLGDAVLAVFGAPEALEDHPARAVRCGVALRERIEELDHRWRAEGFAQEWEAHGIKLRARIGVHTGRVVAGNMGGPTRMKYAILGDTVNLAARIEGLNELLSTGMLVSDATYERLPSDLVERGEPRGAQQVKGREQRVAVFSY